MTRFARLNDPDPRVRARLQAALYINRRKKLTGATGGEVSSVPFIHDSNTFWWDFTNDGNTVDETGDDTISEVVERIRGERSLVQVTKDLQPLIVSDGINFNQDTDRTLVLESTGGITNGTNGWYLAGIFTAITSDSHIMEISRAVSTTPSRGQIYLTGSRNLALKADDADGGAVNFVAFTPALTLGQKYTFEILWDHDTDSTTMWIDGISQNLTLGSESGPWGDFPPTDPVQVIVGNASNGSKSWDGVLETLIFQNGVPDTTTRQSVSDYLVERAV